MRSILASRRLRIWCVAGLAAAGFAPPAFALCNPRGPQSPSAVIGGADATKRLIFNETPTRMVATVCKVAQTGPDARLILTWSDQQKRDTVALPLNECRTMVLQKLSLRHKGGTPRAASTVRYCIEGVR